MKQEFSGEALSKQNIKAWLALLSCNSSQVPTESSAIFAFGVFSKASVIWSGSLLLALQTCVLTFFYGLNQQ